jgi:hypothetical protein
MAASLLRRPSLMGLMALKHRGTTATFGFLSSLSSLTGPARTSGTDGLLGFPFLFLAP